MTSFTKQLDKKVFEKMPRLTKVNTPVTEALGVPAFIMLQRVLRHHQLASVQQLQTHVRQVVSCARLGHQTHRLATDKRLGRLRVGLQFAGVDLDKAQRCLRSKRSNQACDVFHSPNAPREEDQRQISKEQGHERKKSGNVLDGFCHEYLPSWVPSQ